MSGPPAADSKPLNTVVIAMDVPEAALGRFRARFPQIRFIVPGEAAGTDERGSIVASAPGEADLRNADGFIGWQLDPEQLSQMPGLRWLHASGAGVERYDLAEIAARGVMMTNASGVSAPNMAEHVLGMMIALSRRFPRLWREQARRAWRDVETHREVTELNGQSVLIAGIGDIGLAVAQRARAFGMSVTGLRRRSELPAPDGFDKVFRASEILEAVADADHVVVTLPNTAQSRGLFGAAVFQEMKPSAMIYNVGRGAVIDTAALVAALQSGRLGGAGLDVTDPEPLPVDSPLWDMENVLITAHTSGATPRSWERQEALIADIVTAIQRGERPRNLVDLQAGY